MRKRIITISRQFGSGGHSIGKKLADRLGVPLYDNELVTKIAEKSGFDVSFIKENSEKTSRQYHHSRMFPLTGQAHSTGPLRPRGEFLR